MNGNEHGILKLQAQTAMGALPIGGANVRIRTSDGVFEFDRSVMTDGSGNIPPLALPAPSVGLSRSPAPPERPYSTYDIEVYKSGYYPVTIKDTAIFSGITSYLTVEMIPDGGFTRETSPPRSSTYIIITENEELS